MTMTTNAEQRPSAVAWFEIPAHDLERAIRFYQTILGVELQRVQMMDSDMGVFPYTTPGVGGSVIKGEHYTPAAGGGLIYLNANPSVDEVLGKVEAAGGAVTLPRTALPPGMGFYAHIRDTEGNSVALHAVS
jgi:hypothetical protein